MCNLPRNRLPVFCLVAITNLTLSTIDSFADANSWLKPTSGNWEEPYWSQGILPNYGHSVMITNAGWKAVQIAPSTAQYYPDSLNVYSINVQSPVDSFNTLLVNYSGFDRPLTVNYNLVIGPGAAMNILSSALHLNGPGGVGLSVGGEFNQNDFSLVYGNQADVGYAGPGIYNFNSGNIQLQHLFVGGYYNGVFNQNGGSNSPGILHLESGGTYNLRDGDFNGTTYTGGNTTFRQDGGRVHSLLEFHGGQYILNNGINYAGVHLGVYGEYRRGGASAEQNGGIMYGPIIVGGEYDGSGTYTISNGVVSAPSIDVSLFSVFRQAGGTVTTPSVISLRSGYYDRGGVAGAFFFFSGGFLSSGGISLDTSSFVQNGGTNQVAGTLSLWRRLGKVWASYEMTGGVLTTENTSLSPGPNGGFFQSGGTHRVANELSIGVSDPYTAWYEKGYEMKAGQLIVSNLSLSAGAKLNQSGGTIVQSASGVTKLAGGNVFVGPGTQQFGALQLTQQLAPPPNANSNSLTMPSNSSCVVRFRSSSALSWPGTNTLLMIDNWSGSYLGGGAHRVIFGNSSSGLTPQQLRSIFFRNPAGFAYGVHPSKILPSGEIVPDSLPPTGHNPSHVALGILTNSMVQITVTGDPGYDYGVLGSYDLANWILLTNRVATSGSFSVVDPESIYYWQQRRFYKSVLMR